MMFLLRCPKCKNQMKYQAMTKSIIGKKKKCVYCGKSFEARTNIIKSIQN